MPKGCFCGAQTEASIRFPVYSGERVSASSHGSSSIWSGRKPLAITDNLDALPATQPSVISVEALKATQEEALFPLHQLSEASRTI